MVIRGTVAGFALAEESTALVVASGSTSLSQVRLFESSTASTLVVGWVRAVHRATGQALAVVSAIPSGVFEVGSSWAVAVLSAWAGDAGGSTSASLVTVVADVAVCACYALAALVLTGALVAVVVAWAAAAAVVAAVSTAFVSSATSSASVVSASGVDVGESSASSTSSHYISAASALVCTAAAGAVAPSAVTSTAVVVEAEANPVSLVLQVARGRVVVSAPAVARSSHVSQVCAAVLGACAVNARWLLGVGRVARSNRLTPVTSPATTSASKHP